MLSASVNAEELLKYRILKGDLISVVLDDLGACPLWGSAGSVKKIEQFNKNINFEEPQVGKNLLIPYSFLVHPEEILFLADNYISPKNRNSNLCTPKKKKKIRKKRIRIKPKMPKYDNSAAILKDPLSSSLLLKDSGKGTSISAIKFISNTKNSKDTLKILISFTDPIKVLGQPKIRVQAKGDLSYAYFVKQVDDKSVEFIYKYDYIINQIESFKIFIPDKLSDFDIRNKMSDQVTSSLGERYTLDSDFFDNQNPRVKKIKFLSTGNMRHGDKLQILLELTEKVILRGNPKLQLRFDNGIKHASFARMNDSYDGLIFEYLIQKNDSALAGVEILGRLNLDGAIIRDRISNEFVNDFVNTFSRDTIIKKITPKVQTATPIKPGVYKLGQEIILSLKFDLDVVISGNPKISLEIGSRKRYLSFTKKNDDGSLIFSYRVQNNDFDYDGIKIGQSFSFEDGEIKSVMGNEIENSIPEIISNQVIVNSGEVKIVEVKTKSDQLLKAGGLVELFVLFNEKVSADGDVFLKGKVGSKQVRIPFRGGFPASELKFVYKVQKEDHDKKIIIQSPLITESSVVSIRGNTAKTTFSNLTFENVKIDTVKPRITGVVYPEKETFQYDDRIQLLVKFSEPVKVKAVPRIPIAIRSGEVFALYKEGSGSDVLTFEYTVRAVDNGEEDPEVVPPLELEGGMIYDYAGNESESVFSSVRMKGVRIKGDVNYGVIQENRALDRRKKKESQQPSVTYFQTFYELKGRFGNVRIETIDKEDGARSILSSSAAIGAELGVHLKWNPIWKTRLLFGYRTLEFEEASNFSISRLKNEYYKFYIDQDYYLTNHLKLSVGVGSEQMPYLHSRGTFFLVIDPINAYRIRSLIDWNFYNYASLQFGSAFGVRALLPKRTDNFKLKFGNTVEANIYAQNPMPNSMIRFEGFIRRIAHDSDIFTQSTLDTGVSLTYQFHND